MGITWAVLGLPGQPAVLAGQRTSAADAAGRCSRHGRRRAVDPSGDRSWSHPGRLHPPRRDPSDRYTVRVGAQPAHRRTGRYPLQGQAAADRCSRADRRGRRSRAIRHDGPRQPPVRHIQQDRFRHRRNPTPMTFTWPGPQALSHPADAALIHGYAAQVTEPALDHLPAGIAHGYSPSRAGILLRRAPSARRFVDVCSRHLAATLGRPRLAGIRRPSPRPARRGVETRRRP